MKFDYKYCLACIVLLVGCVSTHPTKSLYDLASKSTYSIEVIGSINSKLYSKPGYAVAVDFVQTNRHTGEKNQQNSAGDCYLLTSLHTLEGFDRNTQIEIKAIPWGFTSRHSTASFFGKSIRHEKTLDVALFKIKRSKENCIFVVPSKKRASPMRSVIALGSPDPSKSDIQGFISNGIISGYYYDKEVGDLLTSTLTFYEGFSGGPVFDLNTHELLGIIHGFDEDHDKISFATPSDRLYTFLKKYLK